MRKDIEDKQLFKMYLEEELPTSAIEENLKCTRGLIRYRFRKAGLKFRSVKEAMNIAILRGRRKQSGEGTPHWGGGRSETGEYTLIKKPEHPRANRDGYVSEHILVWEEVNHMSLPSGYVIHHLNGIKKDNRPKNLIAILAKNHSPNLIVKEIQKRLREVEAELSQQRIGF